MAGLPRENFAYRTGKGTRSAGVEWEGYTSKYTVR